LLEDVLPSYVEPLFVLGANRYGSAHAAEGAK